MKAASEPIVVRRHARRRIAAEGKRLAAFPTRLLPLTMGGFWMSEEQSAVAFAARRGQRSCPPDATRLIDCTRASACPTVRTESWSAPEVARERCGGPLLDLEVPPPRIGRARSKAQDAKRHFCHG